MTHLPRHAGDFEVGALAVRRRMQFHVLAVQLADRCDQTGARQVMVVRHGFDPSPVF